MENKEITSEVVTAKEWKNLSVRTFNQVNKKLWAKGRIRLGLGVVIICLLASILGHIWGRHHRDFDRGYGMMQGREAMMWNSRRGGDQFQERGFGRAQDGQTIQGCAQQATLQIDPNNPNAQVVTSQVNCPFADQANTAPQQQDWFFDRMEARMQQVFGIDQRGKTQTGAQTSAPTASPITVEVVTGSTK